MTVQTDLQRAIAMAEAAKGNYLLFATDSEDQKATQVFRQMAEDMQRHVTILESRLNYLSQNNPLNKQGQGEAQGQQGGQAQGQQRSQEQGQQGGQMQGQGQGQDQRRPDQTQPQGQGEGTGQKPNVAGQAGGQ
ncbi:MAG: DUF1657 domain-containing protein [Bacillota bacterium]